MTEDLILTEVEVRVIGALLEKQITTPDYYPLTLNALTHACNQISNRDPVVSYDEKTVVRALDSLREKGLAYVVISSDSRVPKYRHVLTEALHMTPAERAAMCVLMLRGPQTVGEIKGRTARLYEFEDLEEVERALQTLIERRPRAVVMKLPRQAGRKESRYAHLLAGEVVVEEEDVNTPVRAERATLKVRAEDERAARLEAEVENLRREVAELRQQFEEFKKQFD